MPSKKQQFNIVLDENTESLLWLLVGKRKTKPNQVIRDLIATHPDIMREANQVGVTPAPEVVNHGGRHQQRKSAQTDNSIVPEPHYEAIED